jgi:gliding motility-associated-like protein
MKYLWLYGDGSSDTNKQSSNVYSGGNNYNVKLLVTTNHNCLDSISKPIIVLPHPVAKFTINDTAQCLNAQSFDLTDVSNIQYGTYTNSWLFDDNTNLNTKNVNSKTFNTKGYHKIVLALNSNFNCVDTISRMVFLEDYNNTRIDVLSLDSQCYKGNYFDFKNINLSSTVVHNNFEWHLGDGNIKNGSNVNHKYPTAGEYQVLLISTSNNNCIDSGTATVVVHPNPQTNFTCEEVCFVGENEFIDQSTIAKGNIVEYNWKFENGVSSNLQNPKVNFNTPGKYDAELIVKSDKNCYDTLIILDVAWLKEKPIADFAFKRLPDKQFDVATIQFTNLSSNDVVSSFWDFGNMNTSNEFEPEADFNDTFEKKITLVVTNQVGCKDTTEQMTGSLVTDFVFFMPNSFSPDNNNINDVLKPVSTPYVNKYIFQIFNRWGEKVFETNDILQGWDGTYNGEPCEQGAYLCKIYLIPKRGKLQSHELIITLLR